MEDTAFQQVYRFIQCLYNLNEMQLYFILTQFSCLHLGSHQFSGPLCWFVLNVMSSFSGPLSVLRTHSSSTWIMLDFSNFMNCSSSC